MKRTSGNAEHWNEAYRNRGADVSWFQPEPTVSLELIALLGVTADTAVIDVGGGESMLVDRLVEEGFHDVTVLDLSEVALEEGRRRLGGGAPVTWLHQDLLAWNPTRRYGLWHDRALFHFLTRGSSRERYLGVLHEALAPGGALVVATFAEDGPTHCSGLPVARYSADDLLATLGAGFEPAAARRELHSTPQGVVQPFTWFAARVADRGP